MLKVSLLQTYLLVDRCRPVTSFGFLGLRTSIMMRAVLDTFALRSFAFLQMRRNAC